MCHMHPPQTGGAGAVPPFMNKWHQIANMGQTSNLRVTRHTKKISHLPTPRWSISCPPPPNRSLPGRAEDPRVVRSIQAPPAPVLTPSIPTSACLYAAVLAGSQAGPAHPVATVPRLPSAQGRQIGQKHTQETAVPFPWGDQ